MTTAIATAMAAQFEDIDPADAAAITEIENVLGSLASIDLVEWLP